jgi:hypothetical protein
MNFTPRTEGQLRRILPAGRYGFEVLEAEDKTSKKGGNEMIALKIGIWEGEHIKQHVYDYLGTFLEYKIKHFCDATNLTEKYQAGTLCAADCIGRSGMLKLIIDHDESGKYGDKNAVADYIKREEATQATQPLPQSEPPLTDDDLPF